MKNLVFDLDLFFQNYIFWESKSHIAIEKLRLFRLNDKTFAVGLLDYITLEKYFVPSESSYKTCEEAFASIGRALDLMRSKEEEVGS